MKRIKHVEPTDIERKSMETIVEELDGRTWPEPTFSVVKRCIHTSADFDYADNLYFSERAVEKGIEALRSGATIVTDTNMARAGINSRKLAEYGGKVVCFIAEPDVAEEAKERGCTRAHVSMERAAELDGKLVFAIGNAPTALVSLAKLTGEGKVKPELVIGAPVGFVNVVEAKELIIDTGVTCIVPRGRKGGSNIAAAICNAMLYYEG